ncbi:unnamed protein product, partial [Iphiclides podalirius]
MLQVQGVDRLRVADASIMPTVPSGNTNAPVIMVGERAADFIKRRWLTGGAASGAGDSNALTGSESRHSARPWPQAQPLPEFFGYYN